MLQKEQQEFTKERSEKMNISVVSMSRRPDLYWRFVSSIEEQLGDVILEYLVFVNDLKLIAEYREFQQKNPKIQVIQGGEDFVFRWGHDTVYNFIEKKAKGDWILKLFDTDAVTVDKDKFLQELNENVNVLGMWTYMQRGDVWEPKYQLYKRNVLTWYGLVHENQHFVTEVHPKELPKDVISVIHSNSLDAASKDVKKTPDGRFIILEKTEEGTDSDSRNLLYETLAWKIVNENGRHENREWFKEHYRINKSVIDWYYSRAKEKYRL